MTDLLDRLATKFTICDGCWEWTAARTPEGYGKVFHQGRTARAYRVMYELLVGPIPEGLQLDHLCRNRACVRPAHLEPVTQAENMRRAVFPQSARTECPHGHPYDETNAIVWRNPNGGIKRKCRECGLESMRRRYRERSC